MRQLRLVKPRRQLAQLEQPHAVRLGLQLLGFAVRRLLFGLGDVDARAPRQVANHVAKAAAFQLHQEAEHVARLLAAKAVEELLLLAHVEAGRLLVVERTQAQMIGARPAQLYVLADDGNNIGAVANLGDLCVWNLAQAPMSVMLP